MKKYELFIKDIFDSFKCKNKNDLLKCIPIYDDKNSICGYLVPIIKDFQTVMPSCASLFAQWRNENPSMSADSFTATAPGTEKWLDNLIIGRDDRILFLIISVDLLKIGHIGYSSFVFDEKCCEVDAVLRGEKSIMPGMMTFALRALIDWGLERLELENIRLRVFSDNLNAIKFYKRNGFYIIEEGVAVSDSSDKTYTVMQLEKIMY